MQLCSFSPLLDHKGRLDFGWCMPLGVNHLQMSVLQSSLGNGNKDAFFADEPRREVAWYAMSPGKASYNRMRVARLPAPRCPAIFSKKPVPKTFVETRRQD